MTASVDPRIERTRAVVMRTAIDIVAERGFQGASIDAIAQRSGVARSTIYRHWPDKSDLLLEAIGAAVGDVTALTVGVLRTDLIAIATHLAEMLAAEPMGSVVASVVLESRREPALDDLRRRLISQRQQLAREVIAEAIDRGELDASTDSDAMAFDLAAPIFFRSFVIRAPLDSDWVGRLVYSVLEQHGCSILHDSLPAVLAGSGVVRQRKGCADAHDLSGAPEDLRTQVPTQ